MRALVILSTILAVVYAVPFNYDGYKLYRIHPDNESQVNLLQNIHLGSKTDFWSPLRYNGKPIDVMVNPSSEIVFSWLLHIYKLKYEIALQNVETIFQKERQEQLLAPILPKGKISFLKYNRFDEINAYLDQLAIDYSDIVSVESIGNSYEGRDMKLIQISSNRAASRPVIFIDAGIHAREWIAPAQALYIIQELVENEANRHLIEKVDWHILPVLNPDGYEYTHTQERLWRKTRSPQSNRCTGTDANRNFGYHWGEIGASDYPCDDTFMGPTAFSEIESKNLRDYITYRQREIKLYLTLHSYGNYLLYPWGFTSALPYDEPELRALAEEVNKAIVAAGGDEYAIGTSTNVLYPAAGGSDDWAKGVAGVELSYTVELPSGGFGFSPPPSVILTFVSQTFEGIEVFGNYIAYKFG